MKFISKPREVDAFQWVQGSDRQTWPLWAQIYTGSDSLGMIGQISPTGLGHILVPTINNTLRGLSGDYLVFDGEIATDDHTGSRHCRGAVSILSKLEFEQRFEAAE